MSAAGGVFNLHFGNTPVPYTVSWTAEDQFFVAVCDYSGRMAICQNVAQGVGTPQFGKPHNLRQRETISTGLCDLCGKPLKNRTKVSLSHARVRANGAEGPAVLQVEPLLHRECAAKCAQFCPSLKRDLRNHSLNVRQVTRYRVQFAVMSPEFICHYVPGYQAAKSDRIVGSAKVELIGWKDRDETWLVQTSMKRGTDFPANDPRNEKDSPNDQPHHPPQ